jgi:hypothetical protein
MEESINTNLSDYTLDELFALFDITITRDTTYEILKNDLEDSATKYKSLFKNNSKLVYFFENAKNYLLQSNKPINDSIVIQTAHSYKYGDIKYSEGNNDMFDSNNGAGNPIHRKTVTKLINIDSRFRDNYNDPTLSSTNFKMTLQNPQKQVIEMKLCDLELPTTYYPISRANGNNYMWIKVHVGLTDQDIYNYIHIPDGNYYFDNLITYINGSKGFSSTKLARTPLSINFDLNYNNAGGVGTGTGKIQLGLFTDLDISANELSQVDYVELNFGGIQLNTSVTESISMTLDEMISKYGSNVYLQKSNINIQLTLGWMLGFREFIYPNRFSSNNLSYISESVMDIIGPRYLFLVIDDGNSNNTNTNFIAATGSGLPGDTIARISLKGAAFNIQTQNDFSVYTEPRYYFGPVNIGVLNVKLIDEYQRVVDLNKNDISFTLRMIVVYSAT